jgi:DNA-binding CsgD family transcriptional regulator
MNSIARLHEPIEGLALPTSRPELIRFLESQCARIRADHYLVAEMAGGHGGDEIRIVTANWMFNTIEAVGPAPLARLSTAPVTSFMGAVPTTWQPYGSEHLADEQAAALKADGHAELVSVRLRAGKTHYLLLLSAAQPLRLDTARIPAASMALSYALSAICDCISAEAPEYPISQRERECLDWVAKGKTTMDIAEILDVSSNTINSYLTHVIQKLSARNRAMAIAVAIRNGII